MAQQQKQLPQKQQQRQCIEIMNKFFLIKTLNWEYILLISTSVLIVYTILCVPVCVGEVDFLINL